MSLSNPFIYPQSFSTNEAGEHFYRQDRAVEKLIEFFQAKGISKLKEEDRQETWYGDWLEYQSQHHLYARLLTPRAYSNADGEFDLLRLTRFLEVFGYFSPAHGYSLQVTFLGLFAILMGSNDPLKRAAVDLLERGELFAFGVSERAHGSDLLGNEFTIRETSPGKFVANGSKYYIGNGNCAAMITVLAKKESDRSHGIARRMPMVLFALRPGEFPEMKPARKIRTIGVRSAFVSEFSVTDYPLTESDIIAEGRAAWDAIFGTVTLGKFFLGFGSIGICEHALEEASLHLSRRMLYGKPAIDLPHIRVLMSQAYARLTAMKLYAYRALDYVQSSNQHDRRYQLYCAVQKAKVGTEGVKVMALLSECIGAKAFESDTFFEMALRDAPLIPSLEGSTHINLSLVSQFLQRYFQHADLTLKEPQSVSSAGTTSSENPYLFVARTGGNNAIHFPPFLDAYRPLLAIPNVTTFAKQAEAFGNLINDDITERAATDTLFSIGLGHCLATIAYGQLIAEHAVQLKLPSQMIGAIFHGLVMDLSAAAAGLASASNQFPLPPDLLTVPKHVSEEWDYVFDRLLASARQWTGA